MEKIRKTSKIILLFNIIVLIYLIFTFFDNQKIEIENQFLKQKIGMTEGRYKFIVRIMPTVDDFCREIPVDKWCIITQICHETNFGRSRIAKENNNLFGIRQDGRYAHFKNREECLRRWYQIIAYSGNKHYRRALNCMYADDYEGYFRNVQTGGWANDKIYAAKCTKLYQSIRRGY